MDSSIARIGFLAIVPLKEAARKELAEAKKVIESKLLPGHPGRKRLDALSAQFGLSP